MKSAILLVPNAIVLKRIVSAIASRLHSPAITDEEHARACGRAIAQTLLVDAAQPDIASLIEHRKSEPNAPFDLKAHELIPYHITYEGTVTQVIETHGVFTDFVTRGQRGRVHDVKSDKHATIALASGKTPIKIMGIARLRGSLFITTSNFVISSRIQGHDGKGILTSLQMRAIQATRTFLSLHRHPGVTDDQIEGAVQQLAEALSPSRENYDLKAAYMYFYTMYASPEGDESIWDTAYLVLSGMDAPSNATFDGREVWESLTSIVTPKALLRTRLLAHYKTRTALSEFNTLSFDQFEGMDDALTHGFQGVSKIVQHIRDELAQAEADDGMGAKDMQKGVSTHVDYIFQRAHSLLVVPLCDLPTLPSKAEADVPKDPTMALCYEAHLLSRKGAEERLTDEGKNALLNMRFAYLHMLANNESTNIELVLQTLARAGIVLPEQFSRMVNGWVWRDDLGVVHPTVLWRHASMYARDKQMQTKSDDLRGSFADAISLFFGMLACNYAIGMLPSTLHENVRSTLQHAMQSGIRELRAALSVHAKDISTTRLLPFLRTWWFDAREPCVSARFYDDADMLRVRVEALDILMVQALELPIYPRKGEGLERGFAIPDSIHRVLISQFRDAPEPPTVLTEQDVTAAIRAIAGVRLGESESIEAEALIFDFHYVFQALEDTRGWRTGERMANANAQFGRRVAAYIGLANRIQLMVEGKARFDLNVNLANLQTVLPLGMTSDMTRSASAFLSARHSDASHLDMRVLNMLVEETTLDPPFVYSNRLIQHAVVAAMVGSGFQKSQDTGAYKIAAKYLRYSAAVAERYTGNAVRVGAFRRVSSVPIDWQTVKFEKIESIPKITPQVVDRFMHESLGMRPTLTAEILNSITPVNVEDLSPDAQTEVQLIAFQLMAFQKWRTDAGIPMEKVQKVDPLIARMLNEYLKRYD